MLFFDQLEFAGTAFVREKQNNMGFSSTDVVGLLKL